MRSHALEHRSAHRMVRAAQRVEACFLELLDPAFVGARDRGAPEHTVVVVDAGTAQLDWLTVDAQSALGVDLQRADAELGCVPIELAVVTVDDGTARVQRGLVDAPSARVSDEEALPEHLGAAREHGEGGDVGDDDRAGVVDDLGGHRRGRRDGGVVLDDGGDRDHRAGLVDLGSGHVQAVEREVHGRPDDEMHVAIDPGARVPAANPDGRWRRPQSCSPRRTAGARRSTPRIPSSRRVGGPRGCRSRTPSPRGRHPRTRAGPACPGRPRGPRRSSGTPRCRRGSSRSPAHPRVRAVPPIIASCGRRTGTHGCAPPPTSSMKAFTFGRNRQSSLKEVRFTMSAPDSGWVRRRRSA